MPKTKSISEEEILEMLEILPENKKIEVVDFLEFIGQRFKKEKRPNINRAVSAVESTWGSIKLDKKMLKFIADDKEIEYDI